MIDRFAVYPADKIPRNDSVDVDYVDVSVAKDGSGRDGRIMHPAKLMNILDGVEVDGRVFWQLVQSVDGVLAVFRRP